MSRGGETGRALDRVPLFYSEEETAALLGIHRTTLRTLALGGAKRPHPRCQGRRTP